MIKTLILVFFLFTFCVAPVLAQNNPEQGILNARDQFFDIKKRSIELERMKRDSEKRPVNKDYTSKFPEIKKDFETIQNLNTEIIELTSSQNPLNHATVSKLVSEINQRSQRLMTNLFPPEPEQKSETSDNQQIPLELKDLKSLLDELDKSINSFVHNSMFQNLKLINLEDSLKAQKDLEAVIDLSQAIKIKTKN